MSEESLSYAGYCVRGHATETMRFDLLIDVLRGHTTAKYPVKDTLHALIVKVSHHGKYNTMGESQVGSLLSHLHWLS